MTGDMTSVPLRATDRWTAARMQQGRVLIDGDWNLNLDGPARDARQLATDVIGFAGVPTGSSAFQIVVSGGGVTIGAGSMWIGGLLARNPVDLDYTQQPEIEALPASGVWELYLDAFVEEVQAAEDPTDLLDPALDGIDTVTRSRVGWRVRAAVAPTPTCGAATLPPWISTGTMDVQRHAPLASTDPCAPPDDPRSKLPDGLLRIEVLDAGTETTARFGWSYDNGASAVAARVSGTAVTLAPSPSITFAPGDLAEVSTLARRADRRGHGPLFAVAAVAPQAAGDLVTLGTASPLVGNPPGTCLRRWDGETVGAAAAVKATLGGTDTGITFTAGAGDYLVGDWWGARVRGSAADAVETLTAAPPDGILHTMASLAVVDFDAGTVVADCRLGFPPLTELDCGCTCTVTAQPGDDLQTKLDELPKTGGELCLAAGRYLVRKPLQIRGKPQVVITGVGPATVLVAMASEAVLVAAGCDDIEVTNVRVEAAQPRRVPSPPGDPGLLGALTFLGCNGVRVHDCEVWTPDSDGRSQSGIYVAPDADAGVPDRVEIWQNRLEIGDQQVGVLVASAGTSRVSDNLVGLATLGETGGKEPRPNRVAARQLGRFVARHLVLDGDAGKSVTLADGSTLRTDGPVEIQRMVADFAKHTSVRKLETLDSKPLALERYVAASAVEKHQAAIGKASANYLARSLLQARSIGQGIVIGGSQAGRVRIEGNEVAGAIQGIHVGLQERGERGLTADQVVIRNNTVDTLVPFFWSRQRHAYYVGSVVSLTMVDNHAHLLRAKLNREMPVDAVRIWGALGSWIEVHGVDLTGPFFTGVLIHDSGPGPRQGRAIQHISDVLNFDGVQAVDVPPTFLAERCLP